MVSRVKRGVRVSGRVSGGKVGGSDALKAKVLVMSAAALRLHTAS